jgi:glycosyltransferase involved in cell wall biosynthesis
MNKRIITILYNTVDHVIKARLPLISALQNQGYKVVVIAPKDHRTLLLKQYGIDYIPISMSQYGTNPIAELCTLLEIRRVLRRIKPFVTLNYTVKPNTIGSIAAESAGVAVINNIAGAGMIYSNGRSVTQTIVSALYRRGLRKSRIVFFQNSDDMTLFLKNGLVQREQCLHLPGSGVDLRRFTPSPLPKDTLRFLFVGRLLKLKGIEEYLLAANDLLRANHSQRNVEFHLVGEHESGAAYIDAKNLQKLTEHPQIVYHGSVEPTRIEGHLRKASCVVLPTYYGEGVPRVLLEASASARPLITTDNPGSRDVIEHERNGYMVPPRQVDQLAVAMQRFIATPYDQKAEMGSYARRKVELEFDESIVIDRYLEQIRLIDNAVLR